MSKTPELTQHILGVIKDTKKTIVNTRARKGEKMAEGIKTIPPDVKNILELVQNQTKFTQSEQVKVVQEDCITFLKSLPNNCVDIIVTDPAYSGMNQKMKFGNGRIVGQYQKEGNGKWFKEFHDTEENYSAFLTECKRVMKSDSSIYIMFDSFSLLSLGKLVRDFFDVKNIIVWDKVNLGMGHNFRRRHELIIYASKGKSKIVSRSLPDIWQVKRITRAKYPTQKPVEIFEKMISASVTQGAVVCDPFIGGGSSAIASLRNGCYFIGSDVSPNACSITRDRISKYLKDGIDPLQATIVHNHQKNRSNF